MANQHLQESAPEHPPREWFEQNFVHDGKVTYCSECKAIPWAFIGHFCMSMEGWSCGIKAERISVPYHWENVVPIPGDRPSDWMLAWVEGGDA